MQVQVQVQVSIASKVLRAAEGTIGTRQAGITPVQRTIFPTVASDNTVFLSFFYPHDSLESCMSHLLYALPFLGTPSLYDTS